MLSQHNVAAEPFESLEVCSAPLLRLDSQLQIAAEDFDDAMIVVPAPVPCDVVCVTVPVGSSATHRGKRRIKELQQKNQETSPHHRYIEGRHLICTQSD